MSANKMGCAGWPRPFANPPGQPLDKAPRPLISTGLVELDQSKHLATDLPGARLITVNADEHGAYAEHGNPCATRLANRYITSATLPPSTTYRPTS